MVRKFGATHNEPEHKAFPIALTTNNGAKAMGPPPWLAGATDNGKPQISPFTNRKNKKIIIKTEPQDRSESRWFVLLEVGTYEQAFYRDWQLGLFPSPLQILKDKHCNL